MILLNKYICNFRHSDWVNAGNSASASSQHYPTLLLLCLLVVIFSLFLSLISQFFIYFSFNPVLLQQSTSTVYDACRCLTRNLQERIFFYFANEPFSLKSREKFQCRYFSQSVSQSKGDRVRGGRRERFSRPVSVTNRFKTPTGNWMLKKRKIEN